MLNYACPQPLQQTVEELIVNQVPSTAASRTSRAIHSFLTVIVTYFRKALMKKGKTVLELGCSAFELLIKRYLVRALR